MVLFWPSLQLLAYARITQGILYTFDLETLKYKFIPEGLIRTDFIQQVEEKISTIVVTVSAETFLRLSAVPAEMDGVIHMVLPTKFQKQLMGIVIAMRLELKKWFKAHDVILHDDDLHL
ncbi:uncharacterized protein TNCT_357741 [Trichonephila clavata]|uniref:Uncharacterized protein n=1 Tax=Trichonephila clavata TaxID=2740835 RepID=A0A8X6FL98_TRICU|nr:uncharacterized protein TNCT_357741 [Trichonephila clavata]